MVSVLSKVKILQKCLIIRDDGKVLAIKRSDYDINRAQCWDLPGGGYEAGEDIVEAIRREVKEEVSLTIQSPCIIYICNGDKAIGHSKDDSQVFATCYFSTSWEGELHLSNEHSENKWFSIQEFTQLDFGEDGGFFVSAISAYQELLNTFK
jgi:8-oxo-dGTP diphosphatase